MDTGFLNKFQRLLSKEKLAFRKKALVFGFFLAVSIFIWFMNALSKNYTTEIDYPIRFRNYPENKTLIGEVSTSLKLRVSAHGYTLLQNRISSRYIPIIFNIKAFTLNRMPGMDSSFYFLETRFAYDYIAEQLNSEFEILSIKPDTLVFPFARVVSKKVALFADITYQLDKQLILKSMPILDPDSVVLTGPDYMVDTMNLALTEKTDLGKISRSFQKKLKMKEMKHIDYSEDEVNVEINIEKFTEKILNVPIIVENLPDSLQLKIFPRNIQLSCQVGLSNFDHLQSGMFIATVDFNEYMTGISRFPVIIRNQPNFVRSVKFKPKTVEFLIEKK